LARELTGPDDRGRSLTFGAFLTQTWLPAKRIELRPTTWHGYQRIEHRHVLPALGAVPMRRLRPEQTEDLYESKLRPTDGSRPLAAKTVLENHVVIRGALNDAVQRGYLHRNVAVIAKALRQRQRPAEEQTAWTADQLATFLRHTAGHRHFPAIWTSTFTGMRRSAWRSCWTSDPDGWRASLSVSTTTRRWPKRRCAGPQRSAAVTWTGWSSTRTRAASTSVICSPRHARRLG
jgi:hypothetical protein